jgi:surface protein
VKFTSRRSRLATSIAAIIAVVATPLLVPAPAIATGAPMTLTYEVPNWRPQVELKLEGNVNVNVDWGDGTVQTITNAGHYEHVFGVPGVQHISIYGFLDQFGNGWDWAYSNQFLQSVGSFGDLGLQSLNGAFVNAVGLNSVPATLPSTVTDLTLTFFGAGTLGSNLATWDTSHVTNMGGTFRENRAFTGTGISNWNTSNVTNMQFMFYFAEQFNTDIGSWDVSKVTDMSYMFAAARVFSQDLHLWNVANVTAMSYMFCGSGFNGDISTWNTGNVTDMASMFQEAGNFNQDISNWNVSKVRTFGHMFQSTPVFNQPLNSWNVSSGTFFEAMFQGAVAFNQPLNSWNTSSATNMVAMFMDTGAFNQDLNNWDVSHVQYFIYTFLRAHSFNGDISTWNTGSAQSMESMFQETQAFNGSINSWNVSNVVNFNYMFRSSVVFNQPLNNWNTGSAQFMEGMFWAAQAFDQDISSWDVSNVSNMRHMFRETRAFNHSIQNWTTSSLRFAHAMFYNAQAYNQPMVEDSTPGGWTTANVTDMSYMFGQTYVFDQDISSWNTSNVVDMSRMFEGAQVYNQPMPSTSGHWDTSSVVSLNGMFAYTPLFNQRVDSWNTSSVTNMSDMFRDTVAYNQPLVSTPGHWNTGNVTNMERMFWNSQVFNQDLNTWDTGNVTTFAQMFGMSVAFNGAIDSWDMHSARYLYEMFNASQSFNQPLNNWNLVVAEQMQAMFFDARAFNQPLDNWNTSTVVYMQDMFSHTRVFNQNVSAWDVSNVRYFINMFNDAREFNQDFTGWNTASAETMQGMFYSATHFNGDVSDFDMNGVTSVRYMFAYSAFNKPIGNWDTSTIVDFEGMFLQDVSFNQDISKWDVSSAQNMTSMFNSTNFNMPIDDWDVSNLRYMNWMFAGDVKFNQPIYKWDTSNVLEMYGSFRWAYAFNQDLSSWNVSQVYYLYEIFMDSAMSVDHYSKFLQKVSDTTVSAWRGIGASQNYKCSVQAARDHLTNDSSVGGLNWSIWDFGPADCLTDQSINFSQPEDFAVNKSRELLATATSGLAVNFKWISGPCDIDGNVVTATDQGVCVVAANQGGDDTYYDATQVVRWINVLAPANPDVVYNANGATTGEAPVDLDNPHVTGTSVTLKTKGNLARTNSLFTGWNTKADGTGTHYDENEIVTMPYRDLVLYAEWFSLVPQTVHYDANGADSGDVPADESIVQNNTVTVAANSNLVKRHFHFTGWATQPDGSGHFYAPGDTFTMGANDVTLYAQWELDDQYTVTYFGNGSTGGSEPTDGNSYFAGDQFEVQDHGSLTKEHEHFIGWTENQDGTGHLYLAGDTFTVGDSGNVSLYAQWAVDGQHSVTYDANGADSGTTPDDPNRYYGGDLATVLGSGDLYKHGYTFLEWNTSADGQGTSYAPGDVFSHPDADVVLFAIWSQDPTFTLSYSTSGSTSGSAPSSTTAYEGDIINVEQCNLVRTGFTCTGWNSQADGLGQTYQAGDHFTLGTSDAVLYPMWQLVQAPTTIKKSLDIKFWPYTAVLSGKNKKAIRDFVKKYLKGNTAGLTITVYGYVQHTAKGKKIPAPVAAFNASLQKSRAKAVIAYLKKLGVRVKYKARTAESNSTASNARRATIVATWRR